MPTYYVRPDGNDLNAGTAPTNAAGTGAFRTVNKALSVAVGGETVWIAPGVYRENLTSAIAVQATTITVRGDATLTQVAWGSGLTVGLVRITNIQTNDSGSPSGFVLSISNQYAYYDIRFEGKISVSLYLNTSFTDCVFIGTGIESALAFRGNTAGSTDRLTFDRCITVDLPINFTTTNNNTSTAHRIVFTNCLHYVCTNADRATIVSPGGTFSSFWHSYSQSSDATGPVSVYINNTFVAGKNQPGYIISNTGWGASACPYVTNCLFLCNATTAVFLGDRSQVIENYNAGLNLTRSNVSSGANSFSMTTYPIDVNESYLQAFAGYLPYTPYVGSRIIGAGTTALVATVTVPTVDFSGNAWNQTNPTIGYMDNRQVSTVPATAGYVPLDRSIQTLTVTAGETGKSVHVYIGSTGVTFQTPNLTCYYARNNGTSVNITLVAGNASTWVSGSLFEVSAVTMPGVYKFDVPNAVIEAGATTASIMLRGANAFNGAFVNINIDQPAQSAYLSTLGYKFLSEYAGSDGVLTVNKRTVTTVKCQIADTNGTAVAIGSSTMTVEVYTGSNVLLASYTPTIQYAGNGHVTFVLDTQITGTAGTYNAYAIRSASTTDRAVFGPLQIKVNEL